jgi:hypothetical protein
MTRLEKCELLKSKGYRYDPETGKIYGKRGKELIAKNHNGYIVIAVSDKPSILLYGHQFAWFMIHNEIVECVDHINRDKSDNRISNLRSITKQKNSFNSNSKGYSWHKLKQKWVSKIKINDKSIYLGSYNTEEQARQAYLNAKDKYHII